jgi:hypothetical protein
MRPIHHHKRGRLSARASTRVLALAVLFSGLLSGGLAHGADSPAAETLKALKAAKGKKDAAQVSQLAAQLADLHNGATDKAAKAPIQAALGGLLKEKKLEGVPAAAAQALGRLDDADGAFKQLKGAFPSAKASSQDGISAAVLEATGVLKPAGAVEPTLKLIAKGKDAALLKVAAQNVGGYADSKERLKITRVLCEALVRYRKDFDKGEKSTKPEEQRVKQERWTVVAPAIGKSLNLLVGAERSSADEWLKAYEEAKGKPEAWFK